jgi:PPOX class probable F420-dependent enzyme
MGLKISSQLEERLKTEKIAWLTTVRRDSVAQPTPVWFLWQQGEFLIYSKPLARKIGNIQRNPRVAINLNSDEWGGNIAVFAGEATIDSDAVPAHQVPSYLEKYREGIADIGMTPEEMGKEYSVGIHVRPTWVREE